MKWLAALLLLASPARDLSAGALAKADDKAAQELLNDVRERIDTAKSIRVEARDTLIEEKETTQDYTLSIRIRGRDRWAFEAKSARPNSGSGDFIPSVFCDGKKVLVTGTDRPGVIKLEDGGQVLRRLLAVASSADFEAYLSLDNDATVRSISPTLSHIRDGGTVKLGDAEARVIEYTIRFEDDGTKRAAAAEAKLFIDPATKRPLKKEIVSDGIKTIETYTTFAFDEDLPDSEFSFQSMRRLAGVRAAQLAKSVELYGACTGRHPRSLEDLARRPAHLEPEVFWPDGGFVLGGVVPKDPWGRAYELRFDKGRAWVVSLGADGKPGGTGDAEDAEIALPPVTRRPLGAPSERLQKHFTARVQIQLLAAMLRAFRDATGELPKKKAALWEKPADSPAWPEGGWLPGDAVPLDPWGDPYRLISDPDRVRVQIRDPKARALTYKQLTVDEVKRLEEIARPRLSDDERRTLKSLFDRLAEDDLDAREKAESDLKAWGPAVLPLLDERLKIEKDGEARLRVEGLKKAIPARRPAWMRELAGLQVTVLVREQTQSDATLLAACQNNLSQLWKMQYVYMSQFGGRQKKMVEATGKEFWLALSKTQPPLIDETMNEIFICPASGLESKPGVCSYRGPAETVSRAADGDAVGLCDDEAHGDVVVILRKSGNTIVVPRGGPEHDEALQKTKP